ncbi:MAG: helix-turn-helix domain-containing protein [Bacteroidales bacterium]|nr:helix-turn-helix domain-containing protein [Bacteroidales bacterium]
MGQDFITGTRFLGAAVMIALAFTLAFVNRGKIQSRVYNHARWMFCSGCLLLGIHNLVQYFGHFREQSATLAWIINLMFFVFIIHCFNLGTIHLLRAGRRMKILVKRATIFIVFSLVLFGYGLATNSLINDEKPFSTVTFLIAISLFFNIIEVSYVLHREIRKTDISLTDEELQGRHETLRYTARAMYCAVLLSILSPWVGVSSSLILNATYGLAVFGTLSWFTGQFCRYGNDMDEVIEVNDEIQEAAIIEMEPYNYFSDNTGQKVTQWLEERHYTNPNIIIGTALHQMGITATALNTYIQNNTQASCFRKWLPILRIEEAKRQMLSHPELSIQTIAEDSGFANLANFTKAFKMQEGISPIEWLNKMKRLNWA